MVWRLAYTVFEEGWFRCRRPVGDFDGYDEIRRFNMVLYS
jgi:hypothetical protein